MLYFTEKTKIPSRVKNFKQVKNLGFLLRKLRQMFKRNLSLPLDYQIKKTKEGGKLIVKLNHRDKFISTFADFYVLENFVKRNHYLQAVKRKTENIIFKQSFAN